MKPTAYITGDRRSRAAHDLELEALRDEFLAEALEGYESVEGDHAPAVEALQRRIAEQASQCVPGGPAAENSVKEKPAGKSPAQEVSDKALPSRPIRIRRPTQPDTSRRWRLVGLAGALLFFLLSGYIIKHRPVPQPPYPELTVLTDADTLCATPQPAVEKPTPRPSAPASDKKGIAVRKQPQEKLNTPSQPKQGLDTWPKNSKPLDSVVVVAYGMGKKEGLTGSVRKPVPGDTTRVVIIKGLLDTLACGSPIIARTDETAPALAEKPIEEQPFVGAATMPSFQGGDAAAFRRWVQERIHKPQVALSSGIPGRVVVSFVVEADGRLTDIRVLHSPDRSWSEEVVRVVKSSPRWSPGRQRETPVRVKMTIPIDFSVRN